MIGDTRLSEVPLGDKEWHAHLEGMLNTGQLNPDIIPYLNSYQWYCVNEIKKTFKRIKYRQGFIPETKYIK